METDIWKQTFGNRHLETNKHLANRHLVSKRLANRHLSTTHLVDKHQANRHLSKRCTAYDIWPTDTADTFMPLRVFLYCFDQMSVGQMVFRPNDTEPYWGHMLPFRSFYRSLAIREKERRRHSAFAIFKISSIIIDFNKELNLIQL